MEIPKFVLDVLIDWSNRTDAFPEYKLAGALDRALKEAGEITHIAKPVLSQ